MRMLLILMVLFNVSACKKACEDYDFPTRIKAQELGKTWILYSSASDSIQIKLESKSENIERLPSLTTEKICGLVWQFSIDNEKYVINVVSKNGIESIQNEGLLPIAVNEIDSTINGVQDKIFVSQNFKWSNVIGFVEINYSEKVYHLK